ncbi:MAG: lmo0937 family membrane protein [Alkalibacterium thalassium]|nr:lmo0937 family membrane protein [Alkalibacterium thalassium]
MLWTLIGLLILFWILGLVFEIAAGLVHILLVIALIVLIFNVIPKEVSHF